jgi:CBS domain-containing protein
LQIPDLSLRVPEVEAGSRSFLPHPASPSGSLTLDLSLAEVRRRMMAAGGDALPVLEDGQLVGIVSRAELEALPADVDEEDPLVAHVRPRVVYCFVDTSPEEALATMRAAGVGHLAVLGDDLRFLGLIARGDLSSVLRTPFATGSGLEEGTAIMVGC